MVNNWNNYIYLVGGLEHVLFSPIAGMIQSAEYFSGGVKPPISIGSIWGPKSFS
jgi:hypothetical protein